MVLIILLYVYGLFIVLYGSAHLPVVLSYQTLSLVLISGLYIYRFLLSL